MTSLPHSHNPHMLYRLVEPKSSAEDSRRQEFILNCLLLGIFALSLASLIRSAVDALALGTHNHGLPPIVLLAVTTFFVALYAASRRGYMRLAAYLLVGVIGGASLFSLYTWGIDLPTGLLVLVLGVVMSGVVIGTRFSLLYAAGAATSLIGLGYLESRGLSHPNHYWLQDLGGLGDAVTFTVILFVITIVAWLSNREIDRSLARARQSEKALQAERDQLESRVEERTRELARLQHEKILQLYRFADFGRISSGLLHDIINPLTAVSLNLEQLNTKRRSELVGQAVEGIKYIEQFVQAARQQIQNPNEAGDFLPATEISGIVTALSANLRANQVEVRTSVDPKLKLSGSCIKFHQLVSNLLSNAIDAYQDFKGPKRLIEITLKPDGGHYTLAVEDHGPGIPTAHLIQIFEPFFTTKPVEKGTGIGLFIAKRIVEEDLHGTIAVTSRHPGGTIFTVTIPRDAAND